MESKEINSFYVLFVCKCVLPSGDNPVAVNKYIHLRHLVKRDCHGADFHETRASQVSVSK